MWYEYLYRVLSIVNYIVLLLIGIPLLIQILYVLFSFVKKKTWKESDVKAKIAYLIPAHNEEDVIYNSVKSILDNQKYPREKFDVFVVAHNCTDNTAQEAKRAGAIVLTLDDPDESHRMALYPLRYGMDHIMSIENDPYEIIIRVDADNHLNDVYSAKMNDAYQAGVDLARPYEGAINGTQNFFTKACAMFYVFESRYGSRVRERLNLAAHVNGSGAMMSVRMLKATGGYDCETISEDAEYYFNRLLQGIKGRYVEDAIISEDMPSSLKVTYNRNRRIGSGTSKLLKTKLFKLLGHFFTTGSLSCLEVFMTYSLLIYTVLLATWIPLFYIYNFTFLGFAAYGGLELSLYPVEFYHTLLWNTIIIGASILLGLFVFFGYIQAFILAMVEYKKLGAKKRSELASAVLLFPFFLIVYSITICIGTMSKPKWVKVKRNTGKS